MITQHNEWKVLLMCYCSKLAALGPSLVTHLMKNL